MEKIKIITTSSENEEEILQVFFDLISKRGGEVTLWKITPKSGERKIFHARLVSMGQDQKRLFFSGTTELPCPFPKMEIINGHIPSANFLFKTIIMDVKDTSICLGIPLKMVYLKNPPSHEIPPQPHSPTKEKEVYYLYEHIISSNLEDEEKRYRTMRKSPRSRPREKSFAFVAPWDEKQESKLQLIKMEKFLLFDISEGGMSFIASTEQGYRKGDLIAISLKENSTKRMKGVVKSLFPLGDGDPTIKVGVKFLSLVIPGSETPQNENPSDESNEFNESVEPDLYRIGGKIEEKGAGIIKVEGAGPGEDLSPGNFVKEGETDKYEDVHKIRSGLQPQAPMEKFFIYSSKEGTAVEGNKEIEVDNAYYLEETLKLRTTERFRPESPQFLTLSRLKNNPFRRKESYPLFDLSQGGLSFVVIKETTFEEGDFVDLCFSRKDQKWVRGQVMSVRATSTKKNKFKVGIRFVRGNPPNKDQE